MKEKEKKNTKQEFQRLDRSTKCFINAVAECSF